MKLHLGCLLHKVIYFLWIDMKLILFHSASAIVETFQTTYGIQYKRKQIGDLKNHLIGVSEVSNSCMYGKVTSKKGG